MTDDVHHDDVERQHEAGHARGLRAQADAGSLAAAGMSRGLVTAHTAGQPADIADRSRLPALVTAAGERASVRFLEFFGVVQRRVTVGAELTLPGRVTAP